MVICFGSVVVVLMSTLGSFALRCRIHRPLLLHTDLTCNHWSRDANLYPPFPTPPCVPPQLLTSACKVVGHGGEEIAIWAS
jgi:hypothetical protein